MIKMEWNNLYNPIYVGIMRMITLNFKLWCKPTEMGWKR